MWPMGLLFIRASPVNNTHMKRILASYLNFDTSEFYFIICDCFASQGMMVRHNETTITSSSVNTILTKVFGIILAGKKQPVKEYHEICITVCTTVYHTKISEINLIACTQALVFQNG